MSVEEWDRRQLCPDGGCTGVIGPAGQCKVCGRAAPNWGDERKRGMRNPTDAPPLASKAKTTGGAEDDIAPSAPAALGAGLAAGGWNSRQLCSDGGCIGLIGPDGACKVCRKTADGSVVSRGVSASEAEYEDDGDFEDDDEYVDDEEDGGYDDEDEDEDEEPDEGDQDDGVIDARAKSGASDAELAAAAADLAATARSGDIAGLPEAVNVAVSPTAAGLLATTEPEERVLCSDGACVGVIGPSGVCKICGKLPEAV